MNFKRNIGLFFLLNLIFVISLWLVWMIPDGNIRVHLDQSTKLIGEEGAGWPYVFTHTAGSQLDNNTDCLMLVNTLTDDITKSALENALSVHGYARYWHGYLLIYRPLMYFFTYSEIRYINMFLLMFLLVVNLFRMSEYSGRKYAYAFLAVMCLGYFPIIMFSLQFSSVIYIMLIANMLILDDREKITDSIISIFLIIGMLTNFFDFLTAPLITLGIPLITLLLLKNAEKLTEKFKICISTSIAWGIGYFGTWIFKWTIGTLILRKNIFLDAFNQAAIRTHGGADDDITFVKMLKNNVGALIPPVVKYIPHFKIILALLCVILVVVFALHMDYTKIKSNWILLLVALYPFIWYAALMEHSQLHFIFTYRELLISAYAGIVFIMLVTKNQQEGHENE